MIGFLKNIFTRKHTGYEEWYLSQASDIYDLERRQKELVYKRDMERLKINNIRYL